MGNRPINPTRDVSGACHGASTYLLEAIVSAPVKNSIVKDRAMGR